MDMNKAINVILNIVIAALSVFVLVYFFYIISVFHNAKEQKEKSASEDKTSVLEYELEHKAYDEIIDSYYAKRMYSFEAPEGYEDIYNIGEYCHLSFMLKVYEKEENEDKIALSREKMDQLWQTLRTEARDYFEN